MNHWKAMLKIFRYIQQSINLTIKLSRSDIINLTNNINMTELVDGDRGRCIAGLGKIVLGHYYCSWA